MLLEVSDLGKNYDASRRRGKVAGNAAAGTPRALSGVSFTAGQGEFITVIGPSGAGKSTLLRCLNRLIEPTDGTITFDGRDITHLPGGRLREVRREIAMIFQNYNLVYRLTAIQNVLHGRLGYKNALAGSLGLYTEDEKARAFELLDEVGLGEFAYRRADQLSGGQKQRVGIARSLMQDPKVMLCDEPIASLDPKSSRMVMETLHRLTRERGITCIVNLHQVDFALEFSDRIIGLRAGEKVFEGAPEEATSAVIRRIYEGDAEAMVDVPVEVPEAAPAAVAPGAFAAEPVAGGVQ